MLTILILILTIVVYKKKIFVDRTEKDKVVSSNSVDKNNDIPSNALKFAKARKIKKTSE